MSTVTIRSSKELKASALEKARLAAVQATTRKEYEAQLRELQERMRETEEIEKKNNEQAAIESQAARDQEFEEISIVRQAEFRNTLADEVFTRAARQLKTDEQYKYILGIVENSQAFAHPTGLRALLWDAVAGNDASYLRQAAQKIAERYRVPIGEDDLDAINTSATCLSLPTASACAHSQVHAERADGATEDLSVSIDGGPTPLAEIRINTPLQSVESTPEVQVEEPVAVRINQSTHETVTRVADIKQEVTLPVTSNAMDNIELTSGATIQSGPIENDDTNVELTDTLGNVITGHDITPVSQSPHQDVEPLPDFGSAGRKRPMTEERTHTSSEARNIVTPKKRRTGSKVNVMTASAKKFKEYMEERGDLIESDLACSKCSQDAQVPRVSKCHHVYCNSCLTDLKQGAKGKDAHAVMCCHVGCESTLGAMSLVSGDVIEQLRNTLIRESIDRDEEMWEEE